MLLRFLRINGARQIPRGMLLLLLLPILIVAQIPSPSHVETADMLRNVSIEFPATARMRPSPLDLKTARVETEIVTVKPGDYVVALLVENGIRQDAQALALVYDLNPQLDDIRKIMAGDKIVLPTIEGQQGLYFAMSRGYRVELSGNELAMQALHERSDQIRDLRSTISALDESRFRSTQDRAAVIKILQDILKALDTLQNPRMIVSTKVANQAAVESGTIKKEVSRLMGSQDPLSSAALDNVRPNVENLMSLSREVQSGGSGLIRTTIRTKSAATGDQVGQLTVWYAPQGDLAQKRPCSMSSSPSIEAIARGDYLFWATRGAEVVTEEKPRKIRAATRDDPLDLLVNR